MQLYVRLSTKRTAHMTPFFRDYDQMKRVVVINWA